MNFLERDGVVLGFRPEALLLRGGAGGELSEAPFPRRACGRLGSHRLVYGTIGGVKVIANLSFRLSFTEGVEHDFTVCERHQALRSDDRPAGAVMNVRRLFEREAFLRAAAALAPWRSIWSCSWARPSSWPSCTASAA